MDATSAQTEQTQPHQPNYLTNFLHIPEVFTPLECQRIVYCNQPATQAHVTTLNKEGADRLHLNQRNTKAKAVPRTHHYTWLYTRVMNLVREVNMRFFHFQVQDLTDLQVLEYENTGFYHTHVDVGTGQTSRRKFSMVAFLTPPEEYEGGDLILKPHFSEVKPELGSVVFFPSYVPHEIKPVTAGVRHSMVTWILGPPYR